MSGHWDDDAQTPATSGQQSPGTSGEQSPSDPRLPAVIELPTWSGLPAEPGLATSDALLAPDLSLATAAADGSVVGDSQAPRKSWSLRKRIVAVAIVVSVVAAFSVVVAGAESREGGVHAALASVFSSPTLEVVMSAHTSDKQEEATAAKYSVALTVTSENGQQPLSGSDDVDNYEVSVFRGGVDLGDMIVADHGLFARVDFQAIDPGDYAKELQSLNNNVPPGPALVLAQAFLNDTWVGIDESTIDSFAKVLGVNTTKRQPNVNLNGLRNAFTLSFVQSWDAWSSIHQLSSSNGTIEYSLKLPVQHFVSTFVTDISGAIVADVPKADAATASSVLRSASAAISHIPAGLEIPMTLWVTKGSLTQLDITYKGSFLDLTISHPTVGVSPPLGATMITTEMIHSLLGDYGLCPPGSGESGISGISGVSGISSVSGSTSSSTESASPFGASSCGMSGITGGTGVVIPSVPTTSVAASSGASGP
jgi:membrane-associated protease RseP (regulator of RpoE activity)